MEYSWLERCRWDDASSRFRHVIKNDVGNILRAVLYFGFVMAAYLGLDTLAVAGLAVAIALYEFYAQRNNTVTASNNNGGFEEDGI